MVAAALSVGSARAEIVTTVWTGTVVDHPGRGAAIDRPGLFGDAGSSLVGKSFSFTEIIDTAWGHTQVTPHFIDHYAVQGDTLTNSAVLEINGKSKSWIGSAGSYYDVFFLDPNSYVSQGIGDLINGLSVGGVGVQAILPVGLSLTNVYDGACLGRCEGTFSAAFGPFDPALGIDFSQESFGGLSIDHVTFTVAAGGPVPEPASWALMVAGFGTAGAVLRRWKPNRRQGRA